MALQMQVRVGGTITFSGQGFSGTRSGTPDDDLRLLNFGRWVRTCSKISLALIFDVEFLVGWLVGWLSWLGASALGPLALALARKNLHARARFACLLACLLACWLAGWLAKLIQALGSPQSPAANCATGLMRQACT